MKKRTIPAVLASLCALAGCAQTNPAPSAAFDAAGVLPGATQLNIDEQAQRKAALQLPRHDGGHETVRFALKDERGGLRTYIQSSTAQMRDGVPSIIEYAEVAGQPVVRSGSLAFDALFAHAIVEMKDNSVSAIRDGAYQGGMPIPCVCFKTGEKWDYVWTRDLSYAAALGLALVDAPRVRTSLEFKLSAYRPGVEKAPGVAGSADGLQVVQDTGSGGSWPVSSDRVSWAFGAEAALDALAPAERAAFAPTALKALFNTIENDRLAAFDPRDGLYTGEQSFLDWREQTYGLDIASDLARMAGAKALSTNVAHYKALQVAARLAAEQGDGALATKYRAWGAELKAAINNRFWLEDAGMYGSLTAPHFDGATLHKFDWLGLSLAIITGVADEQRAQRILAAYPHGPVGAPVIWPQQQGVPVYHNRSIWPFVTAYGLDAAAGARHVGVADAAYATLLRGASLHLSNMENMEWLSGAAMWSDPRHHDLDGPVINSRRQLWSVGGYIGMVVRNVFGIQPHGGGIRVQPFITGKLRRDWLGGTSRLRLEGLTVAGKSFTVQLALPPEAGQGDGYYALEQVRLNGELLGPSISWESLARDNLLEIRLGALQPGVQRMRTVEGSPAAVDGPAFAPYEAEIASARRTADGSVQVALRDTRNPAGSVHYRLYRNGRLAAGDLQDLQWHGAAPGASCFTVEAVAAGSGNRSHHSAPVCVDPGLEISVADSRVAANITPTPGAGGMPRLQAWGRQHDRLAVRGIALARGGHYALQLRYVNHSHAINTGITNGVKLLSVRAADGRLVAQRVVQMPHLPPDSAPLYSTPAEVWLDAGSYTVELGDFYNMSYLASNARYGAGGGMDGPLNQADIYGLRVLPLE
jgi:hypothetical protein